MESDRHPPMKWIRELFRKTSDRVGSTQIGQNETEVPKSVVEMPWQRRLEEMSSSRKRIHGIESKPPDRVGLTQIGQNGTEFSWWVPKSVPEANFQPLLRSIHGIESKFSDRVGSMQIGQNEKEVPKSVVEMPWQRQLEEMSSSRKRIHGIESKPPDRVGLTQIGQNGTEFSWRVPKSVPEANFQRLEEMLRSIHGIESKLSDRVGSTQIGQNETEFRTFVPKSLMEESRRRIEEEYREIESHPSDFFACRMLKRNFREWLFGIRGPSETEYEGGIYHGKILFPKEYPSKPPSFVFLTPNGRFKTRNKIRISRLDDWRPSSGVRDALNALIDEMPTYPDGGSVEYSQKERQEWARRSRAAAPECSTPERQKLVEEIHNYLLSKSSPDPVTSQNHGAKRKHGTGSGGGANGSVVNVIGNIFNANNSNGVGIVDSMNEASNPKKAKLDDHV